MTKALWLAVLACVWFGTGAALADDGAMPLRSFDRFEFDSVSANGAWAELATAYSEVDEGDFERELLTILPRLALGGENGEIGALLPYFDAAGDLEGDGIGDLRVYGKWLGHTEFLNGGLGLEISFPTGDEDDGLGANEYGFLPFLTAGVPLGLLELRAHGGYQVYTDDSFFPDSWIYGGGIFSALGDYFALRTEIVGQSFEDSSIDIVALEPGADVRLAGNEIDLIFRLNGEVGLNDEILTPDWGVGGGVVLAWSAIGR